MTHSIKPNRYCAQGNCPRDTNSPKSLQLVQTSQSSSEPARPWFASRLVLVPGKRTIFAPDPSALYSVTSTLPHTCWLSTSLRGLIHLWQPAPPWWPCWCSLDLALGLGFSTLHDICSFYLLGWRLWSRGNLQHWGKRDWRSLGA